MNFSQKYRIFYLIALLSVPVSIYFAITQSLWLWFILGFVYVKVLNFVALQIGLHRYFSHNSFKAKPMVRYGLAMSSVLTGHGSPVSWATHHLHHHKHSDQEADLHSPIHGFFHTILLWPVKTYDYFNINKDITPTPKHLVKDKLVMYIHKNYFLIWTMILLVSFSIGWKFALFFVLMPAGLSLLHGNIVTNYLSHVNLPGSYRNFNTSDQSWNNKWIQRFQWGEGLHNNHHKNMGAYNQAVMLHEFDIAAWVIDRYLKA